MHGYEARAVSTTEGKAYPKPSAFLTYETAYVMCNILDQRCYISGCLGRRKFVLPPKRGIRVADESGQQLSKP